MQFEGKLVDCVALERPGPPDDQCEENNLRRAPLRLVGSMCRFQLWEARSVRELKKAWLDSLRASYRLHRAGGQSHLNGPVNSSIMIQHGGGPTIGILIDWDHSVNPSKPNDLFAPAVVDVSTTAIDHLLGRPWNLLYRYQLESFFYILIWATIHYDLEQRKTLGSVHPALGGWVLQDVQANAAAKDVFLTGSASCEVVYGAIRNEFGEIKATLIEPLHDLFCRALHSRARARRRRKADYDYDTCDDILTFDTFMETINVDPRPSGLSGV